MKVWWFDAADIRTLDLFNHDLLYENKKIQDFLHEEKNLISLIFAPKGYGKTFLLIAKRRLLQEKIQCLPKHHLREVLVGAMNFSRNTIQLLDNVWNWSVIWQISIMLSIFKNNSIEMDKGSVFDEFINDKGLLTIRDYFNAILMKINIERKSFFDMQRDYNTVLIPGINKVSSGIAFFIDNVDEYFSQYLKFEEKGYSTSLGEIDPMIWIRSQAGLADAVYQLTNLNHHIKGFASVRIEVLSSLKSIKARLNRQYLSKAIVLQYTHYDLKKLFIKYILKEESGNFAKQQDEKIHPIAAFVGFETINNSHCETEEDIFDYIHRHTLGRPRDFMQMGMAISDIPVSKRTESEIIKVIDLQTGSLVKDYIFEEIKPFNPGINFNDVFKRVPANILTKDQLKIICAQINSSDCKGLTCEDCNKIHIFCLLFKYGLLGHVQPDSGKNRLKQFFYRPGEVSFEANVAVTDSDHYLIHPVLYKYICDINPSFEFYKKQVIGPRYGWDYPPTESETISYSLKLKKLLDLLPRSSVENEISTRIWELIEEEENHYHSENEVHNAFERNDLNSAFGSLLGKTDITVVDFGAGKGPLIKILMGLDPSQLKTLTYIGFNYQSTAHAEEYISKMSFREKVKDCQLFSFDNLKYLRIEADVGFMIDVLHHLDPVEISYLMNYAIKFIKKNGTFHIFEETKSREITFPWSAEDITNLFYDQRVLDVFTSEIPFEKDSEYHIRCSATLNKKDFGTLGEDFIDICFFTFEYRLELIKEEIMQLAKKVKEKQSDQQERELLSKLMYLSSFIEIEINNAKRKITSNP